MKERRLVALLILCVGVAVTLLISTQLKGAAPAQGKHDPDTPPPIYNPYPQGILPSDIDSEIARVIREVDNIEAEACRDRVFLVLCGSL